MHPYNRVAAAACAVMNQMADNPTIGIPVDADVANFMGAFVEDAIAPSDLADDALLTIGEDGGVYYALDE